MKLHLGGLDILLVLVLVFAGIIAHNWYNAHPTANEYQFLKLFAKKGDKPTKIVSTGGGGAEGAGGWKAQ